MHLGGDSPADVLLGPVFKKKTRREGGASI